MYKLMSSLSKIQSRSFPATRPRRAIFTCLILAALSLLNWWQIRSADNPANPASALTIAAHAEETTVEHCDVLVVGLRV